MAGSFGTEFMPEMALAQYESDTWGQAALVPSHQLVLHPASHVLHYASTCFEGLKAFRHKDGRIALFRSEQNLARFAQSSAKLVLPPVDQALLAEMIESLVVKYKDKCPSPPGSFYIRPTHIGTDPAIGKAAGPSLTSTLFVLLSPVGDYFAAGESALKLLIDDQNMRCAPDHGCVKGGGNYASALKHIVAAQTKYQANQVLFCPDGDVQETGAANFMLIQGNELITKPLDESFLHGVTRDSILQLAAQQGLTVCERQLTVTELLERAKHADSECWRVNLQRSRA